VQIAIEASPWTPSQHERVIEYPHRAATTWRDTISSSQRFDMRRFGRENRKLLASLLAIVLFGAAAPWFMSLIANPVTKHRRYVVDSTGQSNLRFWLVTWEAYDGELWIGRPAELNRETFDRLTGCLDYTSRPPSAMLLRWTIQSVSDDRVVAEGKGTPINPTADDCASTRSGHVLSLGKIAISPGRYRFDLEFGVQFLETMNFPVEVDLYCCELKSRPQTRLGCFPGIFAFVVFPILILSFGLLILILLIRAGMYIYALFASARDQAAPPK
jgi:hypothetical protein